VTGLWLSDLKYAARRLRTHPTFTSLAVLTLALGIGGMAAIFGIARPLLFEPLPYANANGLVEFWFGGSWYESEFVHLRGRFPGFQRVAMHRPSDVTMRDGDAPARLITGIASSAELFDVLGTRPMLGRAFVEGDDVRGAPPSAVLSYGLWRELGADSAIAGKRITLDGTPTTVVGVMPRGFWYPRPDVRIWTAHPINPEGQNGSYTLVGRVSPNQNAEAMEPQVAGITRMLGERFTYDDPQWDRRNNAKVTPIRTALLGEMRPAVVATMVAIALTLLIACANVAAMMLGQLERRSTELAVRSALGANSGRLVRQLVVEALLVGLLAGVFGAGLAAIGFSTLANALPLGAWGEGASFDWWMFGGALVVAMVAVLLVVLVPATALWRGNLYGALARARTGGIEGRGGRLERALVVTEVALAMLIASAAALLARSVSNLYAIDPGLKPEAVLVVDALASAELRGPQRRQAIEEVKTALAQLPGVTSASAAMKLPLRGGGNSFGITVPGQTADADAASTYFRISTLDYFETLGIRLKSGRTFTTADRPVPPPTPAGGTTPAPAAAQAEIPIVINEALAKKFFPDVDPVGRTVTGGFNVTQRIIGVVDNVAEGSLTDEPSPARYYLGATVPWFAPQASFVIRVANERDAAGMLDRARATLQRVAPSLAVQSTTTMSRVFDRAVGPARQIMSLLSLLAGLAVVLGAIGIYGVISHFATRRRRDWAIRIALGARAPSVVGQIVTQAVLLVALGTLLGAAGTAALSRLFTSFLWGVSAFDPLAFIAASVGLLAIGAAAAFIPARRAGTVDPILALRESP
jgi:putative ABC transport system permease protein